MRNSRPNFSNSSSRHCSTRLPGATIRMRRASARMIELADVEAGHDGLAGTGVVGQDEPQRLAGEHRLVDGGDLVGQRLHVRGVDRHHRVEQEREVDPLGLAGELERGAVAVEGPGAFGRGEADRLLVGAREQPLFHRAVGRAVDELNGALADAERWRGPRRSAWAQRRRRLLLAATPPVSFFAVFSLSSPC